MPHRDKDGKIYVRVTELLATSECEERAYHTKNLIRDLRSGKTDTAPNTITFATIKGTLVHNKVENFLRETIGLPPLTYKPQPTEERILFNIESQPDLSRQLDLEIANGFANFLDYWNKYKPEVLAIEQTLMGEVDGVPIKGSADALLAFRRGDLDELKGVNTGDPDEMVMMITDWKSGSKSQGSHKTQISAYYHLSSQELLPKFADKYPYYKVDGVPVGADVYLGGKKAKFKLFDVSEALFFHIVGLFKNAEKVPRNYMINGRVGLNLHYCLYCPFKDPCQTIVQLEVPL